MFAVTETLYPELARMAGALASPTRLRALNLLFQGEKSIDQLAEILGETVANTSAHMKALRAVGFVTARKEGKHVFLSAEHDAPLDVFLSLRRAGEALAPSIRLMDQGGDELASDVSIDTLEDAIGPRRGALIDLRPEREYAAGHLPGARSVPFVELTDRLGELPRRRRIFVYCRGKYCPSATQGARTMQRAGLRAERLRFGVPEWRAAGHALELGS